MPMTLLEAFRLCAPLVSDSRVDAIRTEAGELLHKELQQLSKRVAGTREDLDDAVAVVSLRLLQAGPRGIGVSDPTCDSGVKGYLVNSLKNAVRDLRVPPTHQSLDEGTTRLSALSDSGQPDPEAGAMHLQRETEEAEARRQLFEEIVPAIASELRVDAQADFVRSIEMLRQLVEGSVTAEELVSRIYQAEPSKASFEAFYQRISRARRRLADGVERRIIAWGCPYERAVALRAVVSQLRRKSV